ncbi:unnamed protein product [Closterium sp. NIES-54]
MRERKGPPHPSSSRNGAGAHRSSRNSWLRFFFPGPSSSSSGGGGGGSSRRIGSWLLLLCLVLGFVYWVLVLQLLVGFAEQKELISETRHQGFVKWERHRHVFPWKIGLTAHPHVVPRDRLGKRWGRKRRARKRAAKLKAQAQAQAQAKPGGVKGGNKTAQIGAGGGAEKKAGTVGGKKPPAAGGADAGAGKSGASGAGKDKGSGETASAGVGKGGTGSGAKSGDSKLEGAQSGKAGSGVGGDAGRAKAVGGGGGSSGVTSSSSSNSSSIGNGGESGRAVAGERSGGSERTGGGGGGEASGGKAGWWRRRRAKWGALTPVHLDLYKRRKAARAAVSARSLQASNSSSGSREGVMGGGEGEGVCLGEECPVFGNCEGELSGVAACWNKGLHDPLLARPRSPSTCPRLQPGPATNSSAAAAAAGAAVAGTAVGGAGSAGSAGSGSSGSRAAGKAVAAAARSALCGHEADFELLPQWMSQVFRLESVRVDAWGRVFNATTLFHSNACPAPTDRHGVATHRNSNNHLSSDSQVKNHQEQYQQQQQKVQEQQPYTRASVPRPNLHLPLAVNLVFPHPLHAADAVLHYLPLLLALHSSLAAMPRMSFLVGTAGEGEAGGGGGWGERARGKRKGKGLSGFFGGKGGRGEEGEGEGVHSSQEGALLLLGAEVTGVDFGLMDVRELRGHDVVLVDILLQPVHQRCHKPSRALWQTLRHYYLLPPNGFPIFNPDFTLRAPSEADAAAAAAVDAGDDWVVVWGKRPGAGTAEELAGLHVALVEAFGARRVRTVGGSAALDLLTVKRTFNRARVFVAPHAPLLNHMVFMPPRAVVLELRPQGAQGSEYAVFHRLADACGIQPYSTLREDPDSLEMATATAARDMEVRLKEMLSGMVLKVQLGEMAGGEGERVAALEAKLREQGDAMAAMQRDMADMRRAMALLKGMVAAGALAEKSEGEQAGKGSASGEPADGIDAQLPKGARESIVAALEVEEVKAQVEVVRGEVRDAAGEMRGEMGALKAELAQLKEAAEHHAAEVEDVKATAARINDVELALAAIKDGRGEKSRAECSEGSAGEHAEAERREGKRRKREEACKQEEMADAAVGVGPPLFTDGGAVVEKRDEAEEDGEAKGRKNHGRGTKTDLQRLMALVEAVEKTSASGSKMWEALMTLWSAAVPSTTRMDLTGISCLSDAALAKVATFSSLTTLNLNDSSGFTEQGVRGLFALTGLMYLNLQNTATTDAALEGIGSLKNLRELVLFNTKVTDTGVAKLHGMTALSGLDIGDCAAVTDASMVHVAKLTGLESLTLSNTGVTEDGLRRLSSLATLKILILPPGVTNSGMKHLRNMKRLAKLGLWDAKITAAGVKWLNGHKWLQTIATDAEDVAELIRDIFPGMIVTPGPL